jgi:hypothetical protein
METLLVLLVPLLLGWTAVAVVVGYVASQRGRDGFAFFFLSLFLSPLVGFAVLALLPPPAAVPEERVEPPVPVSPAALARSARRTPRVAYMVALALAVAGAVAAASPLVPLWSPAASVPAVSVPAPPAPRSPADAASDKCRDDARRAGNAPGTTDRLSRCLEAADALYK